jgi:hypothetical protein
MPTTMSAPAQKPHALLDGGGAACGDEDVVSTSPAGQGPHRGAGVLFPGPDRMARAEGSRGSELPLREVDRDVRSGAADGGPLDAVEADAARADGHDVPAGADGRGVQDGAEAGDDAAGQQACALQRHVAGDRRELRGVDHDLLGECAGPKPLSDRRSVASTERRA